MFVTPSQVAAVIKRHPQIQKARLVIDRQGANDTMTLHCELAGDGDRELSDAIAASLREVCKLRGEVVFAALTSLANDGKVIDDVRKYE
jgi:phenylacetate-CoA ligase